MAEFRHCVHRHVGDVKFLVARFGALPAYHGVALRGKEYSGLLGEAVAGSFFFNYHAADFALAGYEVAESDVVVRHEPFHRHFASFGVFKRGHEPVGIVVYVAFLYLVLIERLAHGAFFGRNEAHTG